MPVYIEKVEIWSGDTNPDRRTDRQQNIELLSLSFSIKFMLSLALANTTSFKKMNIRDLKKMINLLE